MPPKSRLELRPADPEETALVARIIREAFRPVADRLGITREALPHYAGFETAAHLRKFNEQRGIRMYLLLEDGLPVGCGGWSPDWESEGRAWINRIAVRPRYQGKGFGKVIVRKLEQELRRRKFQRARLGCIPDLERFYGSMGYEKVDSRRFEGWPVEVLFMEKEIGVR